MATLAKSDKKQTPTANRIFFLVASLFIIAAMLHMPYETLSPAYRGSGGSPPLVLWIAWLGLSIPGFLLTAFRGDIRLRVNKFLTPLGIAIIAFAWWVVLTVTIPSNYGIFDTLLNHANESYLYATGFGLLIAFVDIRSLDKYAYLFSALAVGNTFLLALSIPGIASVFISGAMKITDESMNDFLWFLSGPLFAYAVVKKTRADALSKKKVLIWAGAYVAATVVLLIVSHSLAGFFTPNDRIWIFISGPQGSGNNSGGNGGGLDLGGGNTINEIPSQTCPDSIYMSGQGLIASVGQKRYSMTDTDSQWIKSNCPDVQWPSVK